MATIFWAGDSTVQYNDIMTYPQTGIGQVFHLFLKPEIKVENHAKNGRSTKSFIDEFRLAAVYDKISEGDFLFIQFGHNDEKKEDPTRYAAPFSDFMANLEKFVNAARNRKALPVLITPLERRCFVDEKTLGLGEHGDYVEAMKQLAKKLEVPLIDLNGMSRAEMTRVGAEASKSWYMHLPAGKYPNYMEGLIDNTHLQYAGAVMYGECIAKGLKELGGVYKDLLVDEFSLQQAIEEQNLEKVKQILIEDPPCIDQKTDTGIPLCLYAAKVGSFPIVKYIVEYSRASMSTVDDANRTILHYAAMAGNLEMNRYLVEKVGMDITAGDKDLITPYQIAWEHQYTELLAYYQERTGAAYEQMYHNPIRTGMFPDPSIVRVGEDYYMVNSTFIFFPCIPVSHSKDLIHWEIIGHAITNPEWAHLDELEGGRGYWAPDISYHNGRYYITATYRLNDTGTVYRKQIVVSSDKPEGPYSEPAVIDEDGIDPSIFHEGDRHYMLLNRGARIFELSSDCNRQISEASLLFYGDQKHAPEGPHLLKKDGYYYLFLAEGGTGTGHRITVARSRELMGNYEPCPFNPIMRQMDERAGIQRCGHGKPVCTQNGEWYMVYLCGRRAGDGYSILGRETALDPITWTADGWPIVNNLKGPSVLQKMPDLPIQEEQSQGIAVGKGCATKAQSTSGTGTFADGLPGEFMTPRPPERDAIRFENGNLILKGSRYPLASVKARNILVRRQSSFCFSAEAELKMPELKEGQEAGITCYYDENTWVCCYFQRNGEDYTVQVKEHIGVEDICHPKQIIPDNPSGKQFVLGVKTEYLHRKFYYGKVGEEKKTFLELPNVYYLCDEGISMGKRFTGAMVGIYGYSGENPLFIEFKEFCYQETSK